MRPWVKNNAPAASMETSDIAFVMKYIRPLQKFTLLGINANYIMYCVWIIIYKVEFCFINKNNTLSNNIYSLSLTLHFCFRVTRLATIYNFTTNCTSSTYRSKIICNTVTSQWTCDLNETLFVYNKKIFQWIIFTFKSVYICN